MALFDNFLSASTIGSLLLYFTTDNELAPKMALFGFFAPSYFCILNFAICIQICASGEGGASVSMNI